MADCSGITYLRQHIGNDVSAQVNPCHGDRGTRHTRNAWCSEAGASQLTAEVAAAIAVGAAQIRPQVLMAPVRHTQQRLVRP